MTVCIPTSRLLHNGISDMNKHSFEVWDSATRCCLLHWRPVQNGLPDVYGQCEALYSFHMPLVPSQQRLHPRL